jgi:uncharacterized protein YhaN
MGVVWKTLSLSGFGRYKDIVTVSFAPGINVCIEGNEQGKSTLAFGVAAIIFGLPADSNPRMFGQERFRNWFGPARFEGELEFEAKGDRFRIRRNFDTHRISLQKQTDGQWVEDVGGEHNPQARRPNRAYETKITELFGLLGRDLFMSTFFVTQPIPEGDKIIPEIQQLLSGSGGNYRLGLKALLDDLKNLTRYTGRMGVTNQDMRQDRHLEKLENELAAITQQIQQSEGALQELQEAAEALRQKGEERKKGLTLLAEKGRLLEAWRTWRTLRDRYTDALSRQGTLADASEQAAVLAAAMREKDSRLNNEFALYQAMSPETGEDLAELIRLCETEEQLQAEAQQIASETGEIGKAAQATQECLAELSAVRGRPTLVRDCLELSKLVAREEEMNEALKTARERVAKETKQLEQMPGFAKLGKIPGQSVASLQNAAGRLLGDWRSFRRDVDRLGELESALAGEYSLFSEADEHLLDVLGNYEPTKFRLEKRLSEAEADLARARAQTEEVDVARQDFDRLYGDLDRLGANGASRIDDKIALLEEKEREEKMMAQAAPGASGRLTASRPATLVFALAAGGLVYAAMQLQWAPPLVLAGIGILLYFLLRRSVKSQRLDDILENINRLDRDLGAFASLGATGLGELRQRLRGREEALRRLDDLAANAPARDILAELTTALSEVQRELEEFTKQTGEAVGRFADVPAAYKSWREMAREAADLRKHTADFARRYGGQTEISGLFFLPATSLPAPWPELMHLADLYGFPLSTVDEALHWLESRDDAWWDDVSAEAADYEKQAELLRDAKQELRALDGPENQKRLEKNKEEITALRQLTEPFDEHADTAALREMLKSCAEAEETQLKQQAALEAAQEKQSRLTEKSKRVTEKKTPLTERLAQLFAHDGSPALHLTQWRLAQEIKQASNQDEKKLAGILAAYGAPAVEDLRTMASDAANRAIGTFQEWEKLNNDFPSLPGTKEADPVRLEAAYRELENDVSRLQREEETLHGDIRELELRLARLQGNSPLNIAAGKARLRELSGERERLTREVAALQVAYLEMAAAIDDFSLSYRQAFADKTSAYFTQITGVAGRAVKMDEDFCVAVVEDGKTADISQLSQGARDQLYISLRLAIADLLASDAAMPFIFDDPFLNWDEERTARIRQALSDMEGGRQILLLSHRDEFAAWGKQCSIVT